VLTEPTTTLTLPDGRVLACDDVGDPDGLPVVWLHGAPDSRLARHPDDGLAAAARIRLVAVDRPGYGWSDPPAPDLLTFGDELGLLLEHLGGDRCVVTAWSAGVPWACGAAVALGPSRVSGIVTFGAVAPFEAVRGDRDVAAADPQRAELAAALANGEMTPDDAADELAMLLVPSPPVPLEQARDQVLETLTPSARAALEEQPDVVDALARSLLAAIDRHGDAGLRADLAVQLRPGVEALLGEVTCPALLVQGELDRVSPMAIGRWYAARIVGARVEQWAGAGHQAVLLEWERWLRTVSGAP
jgi:pimeloyl-ACP methyl ester carboxylesterase